MEEIKRNYTKELRITILELILIITYSFMIGGIIVMYS